MKGKGIFLNLRKMSLICYHEVPIRVVDNYPKPNTLIKKFIKQFEDIDYLEMGSLGLKSLLVATGVCDLFLKTTKFRDWDVMPASLFLEEMNCKMLYLNTNSFNFGSQIEFNKGLLVYNPSRIDKKMINYLKKYGDFFDI